MVGANSAEEISALQYNMGQSSAKVDFVSNPGNVPVKRVKYLGSAYGSLSTEVPPKSSQEIPRILTQNFSTHHQKKTCSQLPASSTILQFWLLLSCSQSVHFSVKSAKTHSVPLTPSKECTNRFPHAVNKILLTRKLFLCQIIFNYSAQLYIFFDGSLKGYGACVYAYSDN